MDTKQIVISLVTAALGTLGFSILFYIHPRRLVLAVLGGVLCTAVYLFSSYILDGRNLGGELVPNLLGALAGAGFSEICSRLTRVPVPVYMVPCIIPLVPGSALYGAMFNFVAGNYTVAVDYAMTALVVALGISGGIVISSVVSLLIRPKKKR